MSESPKRIRVSVSRQYDVLLGNGCIDGIGALVAPVCKADRLAVITDDIVDKLYSGKVIAGLEAYGYKCAKYVFPNGEQSKNFATLSDILEFLAGAGLKRNDMLIALGGGVVGDITGLAAALYMRGIGFIQIPTTLLSMVDASVGGKTAVDLRYGKNLAGAFWQPSAVICDCDIIRRLPRNIFAEGMAEVIKCDVIKKQGIIGYVGDGSVDGHLEEIIEGCITLKRDVVEQDEFETKGIRQVLNVGHTAAHALEKLSEYAVSHGEAVGTGLVLEAEMARALGMCDEATVVGILSAVSAFGLYHKSAHTGAELSEAMKGDKKNTDGKISFVLPCEIGKCREIKLEQARVSELLDTVRR